MESASQWLTLLSGNGLFVLLGIILIVVYFINKYKRR